MKTKTMILIMVFIKKSIPDVLYLKNSFELINNLKIQLNNVNISNEVNVNRASLIDFVLNNLHNESILFRNLSIASSDGLNIENNKFMTLMVKKKTM